MCASPNRGLGLQPEFHHTLISEELTLQDIKPWSEVAFEASVCATAAEFQTAFRGIALLHFKRQLHYGDGKLTLNMSEMKIIFAHCN